MLQEAVARVLRGESLNEATRWLNTVASTPTGKAFTRPGVRKMLTRPGLLGHAVDTETGSALYGDDGHPVAVAEALIDRATFDALQAAVEGRAPRTPKARATSGMLSGVVRCAHCEAPLHSHRKGGRRVYSCDTKATPEAGRPCPGASAMESLLLPEVERLFLERWGRLPIVETVEEGDEHGAERARLTDALVSLDDAFSRGTIGAERWEALTARLEAQRAALGPERATSMRQAETGESFGDVWASGDEVIRRGLLLDACGAVFVSKASRRGAPTLEPGRVVLGVRLPNGDVVPPQG